MLLFGCLRSCYQLMALAQKGSMSRLLEQRLVLTRQWIQDLRGFLYKHYWVTSKTMQMLRRRPTEQFGEQQGRTNSMCNPRWCPPGSRNGSTTRAAI